MNLERSRHPAGFWAILFFAVLFQWWSRYAGAPVADHASDAWSMLHLSRAAGSTSEILRWPLQEPDRPLQAAILPLTFRAIGDRPAIFCALGMVMYSIYILLALQLVWQLTRSTRAMLIFAALFSALPNLTESFHWAAMITVAYMQIAYLASAVCWVRHLQSNRTAWLAASALLYAVGVTSYEFGAGLPIALALLVPAASARRRFAIAPHLMVLVAYLAWRFTKGFGHAHGVLFPPREIHLDPFALLWNFKGILSWWFGGAMLDCLRWGWSGFAELTGWTQRFLVAGNVAFLAWLGFRLRREDPPPSAAANRAPALFALAWTAFGVAACLVSWTAGRLNFYPALGACLLVTLWLDRLPARSWVPALLPLAFFCLLANQGMAHNWKTAGHFQRQIYEYLQQHRGDWSGKKVVLYDTSALRQRLAPGLAGEPADDPAACAYYQGASLLRGFVTKAFIDLCDVTPVPESLLDIEHGAHWEGTELVWHNRFDPSLPHRVSSNAVFVVDCLAVGSDSL